MTGVRLALAVTMAAVMGACDGGPSGSDRGPSNARLHVVATVVDSVDHIEVFAFLDPGVRGFGRTREILDPVLGVAGREILPVERGGRSRELLYDARLAIEPGSHAETALTIDPPPVSGVSPDFGPVRWFTFGRGGDSTITLAPGEDLVLDLDPPAEISQPVPEIVRADLSLDGGGGNRRTLRVPFSPVDPIVVPHELLPASENGEILADLVVAQFRSEVPDDEEYAVTPVLRTHIHWRIVVSR